jgi:hypothetical protein
MIEKLNRMMFRGEHSNLKLQVFSVADDLVNPGDMLAGIESVLFSIRLKATMIAEMSAG